MVVFQVAMLILSKDEPMMVEEKILMSYKLHKVQYIPINLMPIQFQLQDSLGIATIRVAIKINKPYHNNSCPLIIICI